ncbi:MAG: hypothetical protein R3F14_14310 [Polyangiaceae bacterium]
MKKLTPLHLGPDVVGRLLPHRRPFMMVDSIEAYGRCAASLAVRFAPHLGERACV